jgi:Carboxypeptidase regulatory-like domain
MGRMRWFGVFMVLAFICSASNAQVFRGGLSGTVVDAQGAVIANAAVQMRDPATGTARETKSNGAGEFNFPEVVPSVYTLTVTSPGFETYKEDNINIEVSKVVNVKVSLVVGAASTIVDVQANGVQVDTTTSSLVSVVDAKSVQDMPMNGRDFTQMTKFAAGVVGSGYANGNTHINYEVDGVDNMDNWNGIIASNQGGIANLPGGLIPIEAIDQFSVQSDGEADQGRNAGANQNMVMKSGTNQIHGDVFFYNRNEFFAAITPVSPVGSRKAPIRNNQFGFTLGGPVVIPHLYDGHDKTFLFLDGEVQLASAGNSLVVTAINNDWELMGQTFANGYTGYLPPGGSTGYTPNGSTQNPVTAAAYKSLFPSVANTSTVSLANAQINNWLANGPSQYNSYNFVIKLDHHLSDKEQVSLRYIGTTGKQTAYRGSGYTQYFQTAPMRIHNGSAIITSTLTPKLLNQVTLGYNYFLQTFNDADQGFYPGTTDGINVGATGIIAAGAPTISISGFQGTGTTQPAGRTDIDTQFVESLRWTIGKHSMKFGLEYRPNYSYDIGLGSSRGTFSFDGTGGPWSSTSTFGTVTPACISADPTEKAGTSGVYTTAQITNCAAQYCYAIGQQTGNPNSSDYTFTGTSATPYGTGANITCNPSVLAMADYWIGQTSASTSSAKLRIGSATRTYWMYETDFWASDTWQATQKLSLNYGFRYSLPGNVEDTTNDLYGWAPGRGFIKPSYNTYYGGFAPRLGFSFSPFGNNKTAIRGAWGIIYDVPSMSSMATGSSNPAGPNPSYVATTPSFNFVYGQNQFTTAAVLPVFTGTGIQPNYRISYQENFSFDIEQQLAKSTLLTLGYSGAEGRRTQQTWDYNQATSYSVKSGTIPAIYHRPADLPNSTAQPVVGLVGPSNVLEFPGQTVATNQEFTTLTNVVSGGTTNFNSANVTLRQTIKKGLTANVNYIWSNLLGTGSPIDNYNSGSTTCTNCFNGLFPDGKGGAGSKAEYGPLSGNTRHTLDGFVTYNLPNFNTMKKLTTGWQFNALFKFYTGAPITPTIGADYSFTGESTSQRPNIAPGLSPYIAKTTITNSAGARTYQVLSNANGMFTYPCGNPTAPCAINSATPPPGCVLTNNKTGCFGVYGNERPGQFVGTGLGDVDFSLFKYTHITEKINTEFRAEVFNIFNQSNLAGPGTSAFSTSSFGVITNTAQATGNPGLGYGEPFNVQFALKILF